MLRITTIFLLSFWCIASDLSPFLGDWEGNCQSGDLNFKMGLVVKKESALKYSWLIIYHLENSLQHRDYTLLIDKSLDGSFIIDENNGLLLQGQLVGNIMHQLFRLQAGPIIATRYEATKDLIKVELPSYSQQNPIITSTEDLKNKVFSYKFTGVQSCTLFNTKS